jgi:hypothetical protein
LSRRYSFRAFQEFGRKPKKGVDGAYRRICCGFGCKMGYPAQSGRAGKGKTAAGKNLEKVGGRA